MVADVLKTKVDNKNDLQILKRASYRKLYGGLTGSEFNVKLYPITFKPMLDTNFNKTYDDMMEVFVLKNIQKNLNITFLEFMKLPIETVHQIITSINEVNDKLLKIKEEKVEDEIKGLY